MILDNAINKGRKVMTSEELIKMGENVQIIDTRSAADYTKKGHVEGAINIPHSNLRKALDELDPEKITVTYCNKGVTGNATQNILINHGFKNAYNLSGGHKFYKGTIKYE